MNISIPITFITPCFCRGIHNSNPGIPEIRSPSIRGQLHWWLRALGYDHRMESSIFGGVGKPAKASPIVVRVSESDSWEIKNFNTLPHKVGGRAAPKSAIAPYSTFTLNISSRLQGLLENEKIAFERALKAWLHMGTLGLRATRAAGSFYWDKQPQDIQEWNQNLVELLNRSSFKVSILGESFVDAEEARKIVSDTIGGRDDQRRESSLHHARDPLGSMSPRKTSPLRFRILFFSKNDYRILAIWDGRSNVTQNQPQDLQTAIDLLCNAHKKIGVLLKQAQWLNNSQSH